MSNPLARTIASSKYGFQRTVTRQRGIAGGNAPPLNRALGGGFPATRFAIEQAT